MKYILLTLVSTLLSCASQKTLPITYYQHQNDLQIVKKNFNNDISFTYYYNNLRYYFATVKIKDSKDTICPDHYLLGYEQGKLKYLVDYKTYLRLQKVYENKKLNITDIIKKSHQQISQLSNFDIQCTAKVPKKPDLLLASPYFIMGFPILLQPSFWLLNILLEVKPITKRKRLNKLSLGMSLKEVAHIIGFKLKTQVKSDDTIYYLDYATYRAVLYFKNNLLYAYARGKKDIVNSKN